MTMDDDFLQGEISSLTDGQEIILSVLFIVSGVLSMFGSSTIVYRVVTNQKRSKPYDRIMLGLSVCDIVASLTYIMTPFLLPKETSQRVWASGSNVSCSFLGWLTQFSFAAVMYNALLSYYYLLTLKYSVSAEDFAARYEPYWHSLTIFFFLFSATSGVPFGIFSELEIGQGCWIGEYPAGCEARGDCIGSYIGWVYGGLPVLFAFASLPINNLLIYCHVKSMLKTGHSHSPVQEIHIRRVATQGFLYVATFFLSYAPGFALRVIESLGFDASQEADIFGLLALNSFLFPLQGFFNVFVFTRPNFLRLKRAGLSNWEALRGALFETDIPRFLTQTRTQAGPSIGRSQQSTTQIKSTPVLQSVFDPVQQPSRISLEQQEFEFISAEISAEISTEEDRDSSEEAQNPAPITPLPANGPKKSCLKPSSKRAAMDGSIVYSNT